MKLFGTLSPKDQAIQATGGTHHGTNSPHLSGPRRIFLSFGTVQKANKNEKERELIVLKKRVLKKPDHVTGGGSGRAGRGDSPAIQNRPSPRPAPPTDGLKTDGVCGKREPSKEGTSKGPSNRPHISVAAYAPWIHLVVPGLQQEEACIALRLRTTPDVGICVGGIQA